MMMAKRSVASSVAMKSAASAYPVASEANSIGQALEVDQVAALSQSMRAGNNDARPVMIEEESKERQIPQSPIIR